MVVVVSGVEGEKRKEEVGLKKMEDKWHH